MGIVEIGDVRTPWILDITREIGLLPLSHAGLPLLEILRAVPTLRIHRLPYFSRLLVFVF